MTSCLARGARPTLRGRFAARRILAAVAVGVALAAAPACENTPSAIGARVLERYRKVSGAKPLTAGGMIRLRLARPAGETGETGSEEVSWAPGRFRDAISSAGLTTVRGIETGRAFFVDGDGVTRVASEPVLRELLTRSYFWRRAWLFRDFERALMRLGPSTADAVSLKFDVFGGHPLLLTFSTRDGRLVSASAPRFRLEFQTATRYRDVSDPLHPVEGEIAWTGLPTGNMPFPEVGGARSRYPAPASRVASERSRGALVVAGNISGRPARVAIDGSADGPLLLSPDLAGRLGLATKTDVFGRRLAAGATLEIGGVFWPSLWAQIADEIPGGVDAAAGACVFRESVVELDAAGKKLGLHDPERWVTPEGYVRIVIDDDDDRPVATLRRGTEELRLTAASDAGAAALELSAQSARRAGLEGASQAEDLHWGPLRLPPLALAIHPGGFAPDWGDDGRLGFPIFERCHAYIDMPQRWAYVKPIDAGAP